MIVLERCNFASLVYAIGLLTTIFRNCQGQTQTCQNKNNCKFTCRNIPGRTSDVIIDLSTLDKKTSPRFPRIKDALGHSYIYEWNPCTPFTITSAGNGCSNVNACQVSTGGTKGQFNIGQVFTMYHRTDDDTFYIHYTTGEGLRTTTVSLVYKEGEEGTVSSVEENPENHYSMTLYTKYAPHSGSNDNGGGGGISTGTVLLIIFFTLVVLYFGIGIAFLKYRREAQGKDMIPNYEFWSKLTWSY